jgi:hypothetical protein
MWTHKKDDGISLPPGRSLEIELCVEWKKDKDEVVITTDKEKFVLNGKNELFLEVTSSNACTVRVQIVPDFKKRTINIVQIMNTNVRQTADKSMGKIEFVGIDTSKDDTVHIGEFLKKWDENIETFGKRINGYKIRRNIFMIFGIMVAAGNTYMFIINNSPMRYINAAFVIVCIYLMSRLWISYRGLFRAYEEYKEQRSRAFEVAKDN